jgi:hypothetical protein
MNAMKLAFRYNGRHPRRIVVSSALTKIAVLGIASFLVTSSGALDFGRDIEPILNEHCIDCHGPDQQKNQFRVDRRSVLLAGGNSGEPAVKPGDAEGSYLFKLISGEEAEMVMPPKGDALSGAQIESFKNWILEGAKTPPSYGPDKEVIRLTHWSLQPVKRPEVDNVSAIDDFIQQRLTKKGLHSSPRASDRKLIRRLFMVMHGLPPTPEQVERFVSDDRPAAWRDLVDEALASPRYGERWATHWLDLVRFGETHGFETNRERIHAWYYRDWVIDAFNADKPYDEFVRQQIAGDQFGSDMGTGFLVAGPFDLVKGKDPKLRIVQRMNELDDMINTTGTAFLGLTLGCARCHNHKFDPISQKDYYSMQAIFAGVAHSDRNLPLPKDRPAELTGLDIELASLRKQLVPFVRQSVGALVAIDDAGADHLLKPRGKGKNPGGTNPGFAQDPGSARRAPNVSGGEYTWWTNPPGMEVAAWRPHLNGRYRVWLSWGAGHSTHTRDAQYYRQTATRARSLVARVDQQRFADGSGGVVGKSLWSGFYDGGIHEFQPGDSLVLVGGQIGTAITADIVLFEPVSEQAKATGPSRPPIRERVNAAHNIETFSPAKAKFVRFTIEACSTSQPCIDELEIFSGDANVALASRGAKASSAGDFKHPSHKLAHINDGKFGNANSWISAKSKGWVQIELPEVVEIDRIEWARDRQKKYTDRVPTGYRIEVATQPGEWFPVAGSGDRLAFNSQGQKTGAGYDFNSHEPAAAKRGRAMLVRLEAAMKARELAAKPMKAYIGKFSQPGPTHRLYRGEPDQKREEVNPALVAALTPISLARDAPEPARRKALAVWITNRRNPLTARVIVNRLWQFHFGEGIVDTPSDFGANGSTPTHPELLDWLASELMANGWSLKHLHRVILLSATWQQESVPNPKAMKVDAASRLLWRFPSRRIEAEGIRDAMLLASGVLDLSMGGKGFDGFEVEMENVRHFHPKTSFGPADWRRMIYMTKVRQEKDAVFGAFDCPDASQVVPKRSRSTTPLQALNLLNSTFVMQQADLFAKRLQQEAGDSVPDQIKRAYQLAFGRQPAPAELKDAEAFIQTTGLLQFARAMLNANEFVFIP